VPEPVPVRRPLDGQYGQRGVQAVERLRLGDAGQRHELVGVERGTGDRDVFEHRPHPRIEQVDHDGAGPAIPLPVGAGQPGDLHDRERQAGGEPPDLFHRLRG